MKAIKLDADSLEKAQLYIENQIYLNNLKDLKKKQGEMKNKAYDQQFNKIETRNNSPPQAASQQNEPLETQTKFNTQKVFNGEQQQKQSRSSVKLPMINIRGNKRSSHDSKADQKVQNSDFVKENKLTITGTASQPKYKGLGKMTVTEDNENDKVASFLKYIQIKPMKPAEKVLGNKTDMSVRDLKILRQQKSIPVKQNRFNDRQTSSDHIQKKSAENKSRLKRNEEKSEKVISNYTIRKQKKALSISQNSQQVVKRRLTNSYYDFCNFVCLLNKVQRPSTPAATYKAYVGKGNNSILVKNCLKSRFWWNIVDGQSEVNLYWTQVRDQKFVETLKCFDGDKLTHQISQKKAYQFLLPKDLKQGNEKNQQIRQYVNAGMNKLLSEEERKNYSKSQYQVQILAPQFEQLGIPNKNRMHNHLQFHWHISNKKALYYNLKKYYTAMKQDPFEYIPLTFHIQKYGDEQWERFMQAYKDRQQDIKKKKELGQKPNGKKKKQKNLWIVKPGENSNQGNGIQVFDNYEQIAEMVKNSGDRGNGRQRSYIVQRYLMPFLYNKRKFDIRCYVLVTSVKGIYKAYWYEQGYIRTSSKQFTLKNLKNRFIHLTNDAVQKKSQDYGKYENGNKISFSDFQKYLDNCFPEKEYKFFKTVYPSMIKRAADAIKSTCMLMDSKKREFSFEIFGLDFMIDQDFATWLIQVNTNPCLQLSSPLLARIIPNMVQNSLKIAIDPLFPPPREVPKTKSLPLDLFESNKFTLIFNSCEDHQILTNLTKDTNLSNIVENDEQDQIHDEDQQ